MRYSLFCHLVERITLFKLFVSRNCLLTAVSIAAAPIDPASLIGVNELNAELATRRGLMQDFQWTLDQLRQENESLSNEVKQKDRDLVELVAYWKAQGEQKDQEVSDLKSEVARMEKRAKEQEEETENRVRHISQDHERVVDEMNDQIQLLQNEIQVVEAFKQNKAAMEQELEIATQEMEDMRVKFKLAASEMEHKFYQEKVRLSSEFETKLNALKKSSQEEVIQRLDASTKKILLDNKKLEEDLSMHISATDELLKENAELSGLHKVLKRDISLKDESIQLSAKHGSRQSKEIKELNTRCRSLERALDQLVRDFEKQKEKLKHKAERDLEDLALEKSGLQRLLDVKSKELKKMRKLARHILEQRSEVEQFFLEALEETKLQIARAREAERRLHPSNTTSGQNGGMYADEHESMQRVTLADLSLEERERVLRILFSKINRSQADQPNRMDVGQSIQSQQRFDLLRSTSGMSESLLGSRMLGTTPQINTAKSGSNLSSRSSVRSSTQESSQPLQQKQVMFPSAQRSLAGNFTQSTLPDLS